MNKNLYLTLMSGVLTVGMFISFRFSNTPGSETPNLIKRDRKQLVDRDRNFLDSLKKANPDFLKGAGM